MHFDFAFLELDIAPFREDIRSYVIRITDTHPERTGQASVLCEVSREALFERLTQILGGERSGAIGVFATDEAFDYQLRLEQQSFTDGERGPDGYPRNLAGVALNVYRRTPQAEQWCRVGGQVMSMAEALCLFDALRNDQNRPEPSVQSASGRAERVVMTNAGSSLAPIRGSDPAAPVPPFPER
jgi:hypothetical protein